MLDFVFAIVIEFITFVERCVFRIIHNLPDFFKAETADHVVRGKGFCKSQDLPFNFVVDVLIF